MTQELASGGFNKAASAKAASNLACLLVKWYEAFSPAKYSAGTKTKVTTLANKTPKDNDVTMGIKNCA